MKSIEETLGPQDGQALRPLVDPEMLTAEHVHTRRRVRLQEQGDESMAAKTESKELVTVDPSQYAMVTMTEDQRLAIQENVGPGGVGLFDLERIKVPTGGGTAWEVDGEMQRTVEGVIVHFQDRKVFYKEPYGQGEAGPPDCMSLDLVTGEGNPGGPCARCPWNRWGSAEEIDPSKKGSNAKACAEIRILLLVEPTKILPTVLIVPTGSIKEVRSYFLKKLGTKGIPYWSVVTRFGLQQTKNRGGIAYSQITFERGDEVDKVTRETLRQMADTFAPTLDATVLDRQDVDGPPQDS